LFVFLSFLCHALLLWLRIQALYWLRQIGQIGHPSLILTLEDMISVFPQLMLDLGLWYITFIMLSYSAFFLVLSGLYYEGMLNFIKSFFCIYWDDVIFVIDFIHMQHNICWFVCVESCLHTLIQPNLFMVQCFLSYCFI
jgi:hypothetical protein